MGNGTVEVSSPAEDRSVGVRKHVAMRKVKVGRGGGLVKRLFSDCAVGYIRWFSTIG